MTEAPAGIGHNCPPAPTPLEGFTVHIDDLFTTATGFLDGEPIANKATADLVGKLIDEARQAQKDATAARMEATRPLDEAKAAIMDAWRPLIDPKAGKCQLAIDTAKRALVPWLEAEEAAQKAAAEAARIEATRLADEARKLAESARADDLAAQAELEAARKVAGNADKAANRADKARPNVAGGARAIGLRTSYIAELIDPVAALKHYRERQPEALKDWLRDMARQDVNAGRREIPGFTINPERKAA